LQIFKLLLIFWIHHDIVTSEVINMTIGDRIKSRRIALGYSQEYLAKLMGYKSRSTINKIELGVNDITQSKVSAFAQALNTSVSYLMGWDEEQIAQPIPGVMPLPANKAYPLLGDIACGTPILAAENIADWIQFPGEIDADFCLRCRGDSMVDARIQDGDIVWIRQQSEVDNGQIAAVLIGDESTLKRVYRSGDTLTLVAANAQYPPMVYTGKQLSQIRIIGRAVAFLSSVK